MKITNYLTIIGILLLFSCSKDDNSGKSIIDKSFDFKTNLLYVSNGHSITNLQVGDTLTYKYEINSNIETGSFYIIPETASVIKHQRQNNDFKLFYNKLNCDTIKCIAKNGTFKILIAKPGNFQNNYTALNYASGSNQIITKSNPSDISFNAVRIVAYRYRWEWDRRGSSLFGYRYYYRHFHKLYIDGGNQINDNYLSTLNYNAKYLNFNSDYTNFIINSNVNFHPFIETDSGNDPDVIAVRIDKLTFYKSINGIQTTIEYDNIPVPDVGRHDDWEYNGNNNP